MQVQFEIFNLHNLLQWSSKSAAYQKHLQNSYSLTISELLNQNLGLGNGLETHDAGIPVQEVRIFHTLE